MAVSMHQAKVSEARKKGVVAAAATVGAIAATVAGAPVVGAVGLGAGAYLGYKWIKYRIDNGIRF